ncbi:MAG: PolC-type DNA polymerase III [Lachnospiraceae bacterium]|nr:PolC-type DNA polymerase III [Lachnospiraceae bacterium]
MDRTFSEIFPELSKSGKVDKQLQESYVSRITTNPAHDLMRIYLKADVLVPKNRIWKLEKEIEETYFKNEVRVHIIEKFNLSDQYSPKALFDLYKDSILEEIYRHNIVFYKVLARGNMEFTDDTHLLITLSDDAVSHMYEDSILDIMTNILCRRCGLSVICDVAYKKAEKDERQDRGEELIENEIKEISRNYEKIQEEKSKEPELLGADQPEEKKTRGRGKDASAASQEKDRPSGKSFRSYQGGDQKKGSDAGFQRRSGFSGSNDQGGFQRRERPLVRSSNPAVFYGRDIEEDVTPLKDVQGEIGTIAVRGQVFDLDAKEIRNERTILIFSLTDFTDSITCKIFVTNDQAKVLTNGKLHNGAFIKVRGIPSIDTFDHDLVLQKITGMMEIPDFQVKRMDHAPVKRVELHCHTKMSDMDGVSTAADIIAQAKRWGHRAIAITDHGDVQGFTEAYHAVQRDPDAPQIIYGVEAYLVDDIRRLVTDPIGEDQSLDDDFVVFDLETTGFSAEKNRIIEIGAVRFSEGKVTDRFSEFVNPQIPIPYRITELTSIRDDMVRHAETIETLLPKFLEFSKGAIMVGHNADFDMGFIKANCKRLGLEAPATYMDTVEMARVLLPSLSNYKLDTVAKALKVSLEHHHRAVDDAECTAWIFDALATKLRNRGLTRLVDIQKSMKLTKESIRKLHPNHCIVLAKNDLGRINLYRLISLSHLEYFRKRPLMPRSLINKYREGLILGSACSAGELYSAIHDGRPESEIERIASFYDYLEIQPVGNNQYMIDSPRDSVVNSVEDLQDINRQILALGKAMDKLVCATCDVHFLNPEDEIYRRILMAGQHFDDADPQPPLYLHTTEEMLEEFSYLGAEAAEEVVITNPNKIADMCEPIAPVRPDKCPPVIENSDGMLRKICYDRAHEMYGENLPEIVSARLERELNSIIGNGYAVMYIIAQKLVWKSNEDGYLVGSRGSVGSSFVATMAGITEVNPLPAHYLCPHCHYVDFDSDEVKAFSGRAGCDMPDKKCPRCGHYLTKQGFDIPFETFLGFKGNKEPDIDLNFSGDYQAKAHRYTEVIFGEGQTFKAGTIGTLADKTAYGYVKNYFEERGVHKRMCEINRIVKGCVGVHRTTGQHPGGIIVLPMGEEINTFTPVQHPANDMTSDVITTHFDYHSIDSNLLKLDILGHQDPTMIRMLEDLTGLHATDIPLDDRTVMSLFENTDALGVKPEDLWKNCPLGTLGIPEFGTDFAMGLLMEAKPKEFTDLIRISGLSHGTDVWQGNAETLIKEGTATISTCIACRDDIMVYLIHQGLESEESFTIMERVRKGVVAKGKCNEWPQYVKDMKEHGVPDWYIKSCEKIKYMFPKAHAAAYVMMGWRVAYCKVYYPLAYYAAYFSIRATDFSYEIMCLGKQHLEDTLRAYDAKGDALTAKEKGTYGDMRLVQEMYARGFEFLPMDLYKSDARYFQIVDGKLLPPFNSLEGMGDSAAESLQIAAASQPFTSKNDLKNRGKVSSTIVDTMERLGIIRNLPEDDQLSFFDYLNLQQTS